MQSCRSVVFILAWLCLPEGILRAYDFRTIDGHVDRTPVGVTRDIETLTRYLIAPADGDALKARAIYRWIAKNIRYHLSGYLREEQKDNNPATVLRTRRGVCAGFARLFEAMGKTAGLEVVVIPGLARVPLNFKQDSAETEGHAWNAVKIEGRWRLLDATYGSGGSWNSHTRPLAEHYIDAGFFIDPGHLIYSHFPRDPAWQLLDKPLDEKAFHALPFLYLGAWKHSLALLSPLTKNLSARGTVQVRLRGNPGLVVYGVILRGGTTLRRDATLDAKNMLPYSSVLVCKDGGDYVVHAAFPDSGRYLLVIVARHRNEAQDVSLPVLMFKVEAVSGSSTSFPVAAPKFHEENVILLSPLAGKMPAGMVAMFDLRCPRAKAVHIYGTGLYAPLQKNGDRFTGRFRVPKGQFYLMGGFPGELFPAALLIYTGHQ